MKIIGHRGASAVARENSIEALVRAFEDGADGVELDARLCGSGELVVIHDAHMDRLFGVPRAVHRTRLSEIRKVAPGLATLDDAWDEIRHRGIVNVEVKGNVIPWRRVGGRDEGASWLPTAEAVRRWLRRRGLLQRPCGLALSGFDPRILGYLAALASRVSRGLLHEAEQRYPVSPMRIARLLRCRAIHPEHPSVTETGVREAHLAGLEVSVWTVNDAGTLERLRDAGVDSVMTDDPGWARRVLAG